MFNLWKFINRWLSKFKEESKTILPDKGGCLPSPIDLRDVPLSVVSPQIIRYPEQCPCPFDLDILDQDGLPACVGFASAVIKQEKELRERIYKVFDGEWLYNQCKKIDGIPDVQGTYLRIAMKILLKQGIKPIDESESNAVRYRISGYAKVDDNSFEGLKKAIFINGALLAGFTGSNEGWKTPYARPPKAGETIWGHAVCLVGFNKDYLIIQNSWGKNKGENGFFYVPKTYLPFEAWAVLTDYPTEALPAKQSGFVANEYLEFERTGQKALTTARLNLRETPAGRITATLDKGQKVIVLSEPKFLNSWHWVQIQAI